MNDKPVWLLDVDGVINATRPGWGGPPVTRSVVAYGTRWRMRFAAPCVVAIRDLAPLVDVRWATSWVQHADELSNLFGLPHFPPAFTLDSARPTQDEVASMKLTAALDVVNAGRRLVWTDDDAIPTDGPDRDRLDAAGALLIAPKTGRGLRPDDLETVKAYL